MNKKEKNKFGIKVALCVIIIAVITGLLLFALGRLGGNIPGPDKMDNQDIVSNDSDVNKNESYPSPTPDIRDSYSVETKYCALSFPEEWNGFFSYEIVEENGYGVVFYGIVEGKENQRLFSILFDHDEGNTIGYLETEEGNINVSVSVFEFKPGDDWTEEEVDFIYGMQEEMNYVIEKLQENERFISE